MSTRMFSRHVNSPRGMAAAADRHRLVRAGLLATLGLLGCSFGQLARGQVPTQTPPPAPDRGPQILQMQFQSRGTQPAPVGMTGSEATMIYGNYTAANMHAAPPAAVAPAAASPYATTTPAQ